MVCILYPVQVRVAPFLPFSLSYLIPWFIFAILLSPSFLPISVCYDKSGVPKKNERDMPMRMATPSLCETSAEWDRVDESEWVEVERYVCAALFKSAFLGIFRSLDSTCHLNPCGDLSALGTRIPPSCVIAPLPYSTRTLYTHQHCLFPAHNEDEIDPVSISSISSGVRSP